MKKPFLLATVLAVFSAMSAPVLAEKADKNKPSVIDSARVLVNESTQTRVFEGAVVITKGTMVIKAERVELKTDVEGYQTMIATSTVGIPATYQQKREGLDETVEAQALRIDFDGKADTILLTDQAIVRRLAKGVQQDEVRGASIKYFNQTEFYDVKGGANSSFPGGRVRTILAPRTPAPAVTTAPASK